jgi:hypothetical protein
MKWCVLHSVNRTMPPNDQPEGAEGSRRPAGKTPQAT